jgi:hypothetical protein
MRFMIVVRPQRYRDRWQAAGFYAGEPGGGGVCEVADQVEFHRMMIEWPFTPFSEISARPLIEVDTALTQWREVVAAMSIGQSNQ